MQKFCQDIETQSKKIGTNLDKRFKIVYEEINTLPKKTGMELSESKNKITKEILKMESRITTHLEDLDKKMKDKNEIEK